MSQDAYYRQNEAYAEFLAGWDAAFYAKYADALKPRRPGAPVLDVGCGVGQVVARLSEAGFEAYGVDVSEPNIARARQFCPRERASIDWRIGSLHDSSLDHRRHRAIHLRRRASRGLVRRRLLCRPGYCREC